MSTEKSQTDWSLFSELPPPNTIIRRFDSKSHRFYYWQELVDGKPVTKTGIGITSLLSMVMPESIALKIWRDKTDNWEEVLDASSDYGTLMHQIYAEWLIKRKVEKDMLDAARVPVLRAGKNPEMPERDLLAWIKFCEDYKVRPLAIEVMLISPPVDGQHYCMAVDLVCELTYIVSTAVKVEHGLYKSGPRKGQTKYTNKKVKQEIKEVAVLDWKLNFGGKEQKSFYPAHKYQLIAAKKAVEYNFDIKVGRLINWSPDAWRTKPGYTMKLWDVTSEDLLKFDAYIYLGYLEGYFEPSGQILVAPEYTPETKSSDFQLLGYKEYVENVLLKQEENV